MLFAGLDSGLGACSRRRRQLDGALLNRYGWLGALVSLRDLAVLAVLTGSILCASLFVCTEVNSQAEMSGILIGLPVAFVSRDAGRYTPQNFPRCYAVGNPWEDPMRLRWPAFLVSFSVVFASLLALVWAVGPGRRKSVLYPMRWLVVAPAAIAAFVGAAIAGVLSASLLDVWDEPLIGFLCATAVVLAVYWVAPDSKFTAATAALVLGAIVAWYFVAPPSQRPKYDPTTGITRGISTYQTIIFTYVGGMLALGACAAFARKRKHA